MRTQNSIQSSVRRASLSALGTLCSTLFALGCAEDPAPGSEPDDSSSNTLPDLSVTSVRSGDNFPPEQPDQRVGRAQRPRSARGRTRRQVRQPPTLRIARRVLGNRTGNGRAEAIPSSLACNGGNLGSTFDRLSQGVDANASAQEADRRRVARESVLDAVPGQAEGLSSRLSQIDRLELDENMSAMRDVERRIDSASGPAAGCSPPMRTVSVMTDDVRHEVLNELIALAYQGDVTRVVAS